MKRWSTPPPTRVAPTTPAPEASAPPAPSCLVPPVYSQTVASKAYASSPPGPSTQLTPPTMQHFQHSKYLQDFVAGENKLCKGLAWYEKGNHGDCPNQVH
ncbi:hypothetical protein GOBAR_AA39640 [Gossypium barbadense]|uniref:Uncharacterized protein n=1 Tax=Gossypium barbadense TaxID=3634 RepID=A0A2P5VQF0_GOSBA|nr:hypothetical protein GOBAR_AA39640 [Gossypium barbadense]